VSETAQSPIRTALAGLIGNVLEWFDFAVYGYLNTQIGDTFFTGYDASQRKQFAFAVFWLGFLARPLGSIVLGRVGDRIGRRALLTVSICLMGGSTLAIGLLPSYTQIGFAAPLLLIAMRVIQGFSLGGEFTGSMVYTTELASPMLRGLISSSTAAGTSLGFILGSLTVFFVKRSMGEAALGDWGWRLPFIISVVFCIAGYFLRHGIVEPETTAKAKQEQQEHRQWFKSVIRDWRPIVRTFGIVGMTNAAYYLTFTFATEQRTSETPARPDAGSFLLVNFFVLFLVLASKPFGGWLSDKVGRRRLMLILQVVAMALVYPAIRLMMTGSPSVFACGQLLLAIPLGMALGLQGAMLVEIFPLRSRVMSMSLAYSATLALAGGIAPLLAAWMTEKLHDPVSPAYFVLAHGVIGFFIMLGMKETNTSSLHE
jgi:MHS family proline/betaine transporter-like MFS transporter